MCGFYFQYNQQGVSELSITSAQRRILERRGMDDFRVERCLKNVLAAHARLAVQDPENGRQPMRSIRHRSVLVFSGEIFNFRELRERLGPSREDGVSTGDTAVLLECLNHWGERCLPLFEGMFSFVYYNERQGVIIAARDRLGKKPLYYVTGRGRVEFSTDLKCLGLTNHQEIDFQKKENFLRFLALGNGTREETLYPGIHSLPPGASLVIHPATGRQTIRAGRGLNFRKKRFNEEEALQEYETLLETSIRRRLVSDVPLALAFSGGVDSGTLAAVLHRKIGARVQSFTIDQKNVRNADSEAALAQKMAKTFHMPWRLVDFSLGKNFLASLKTAYQLYDEPCSQPGIAFVHALYRRIKPFCTVVLSGNGCDELFLGYQGDERIVQKAPWLQYALPFAGPRFCREKLVAHLIYRRYYRPLETLIRRHSLRERFFSDCLADARRFLDANGEDLVDLKLFCNLTFGPAEANFRLPDITGLANGIEVRSPFLDESLVDWAASLPRKFKSRPGNRQRGWINKYLPKTYYGRYAGRQAHLPKKGMGNGIPFTLSFSRDPAFIAAGRSWLRRISEVGIDAGILENHWAHYARQKVRGIRHPEGSQIMIHSLMLGLWIELQRN